MRSEQWEQHCKGEERTRRQRGGVSYDELKGMGEEAIVSHGVSQRIFLGLSEAKRHIAFVRSCSGHGGIGLKKALCAYWHLSRGKSVADVMEVMRLGESTLVRLQRHMLGDALLALHARQAGPLGPKKGPTGTVRCRLANGSDLVGIHDVNAKRRKNISGSRFTATYPASKAYYKGGLLIHNAAAPSN